MTSNSEASKGREAQGARDAATDTKVLACRHTDPETLARPTRDNVRRFFEIPEPGQHGNRVLQPPRATHPAGCGAGRIRAREDA